jgi:hypothetical protein
MNKEERVFFEPIIRGIMERDGRVITDDEFLKAIARLNQISEETAVSNYSYEHPDYGQMVGDVPDALRLLMGVGDTPDDLPCVEEIMDICSGLERNTLVAAVNSIIYFRLDRWHTAPDADVWMHPLHVAVMLAERYGLRECLPALLEIECQDQEFIKTFFDECDMLGMVPACIYRIATAEDLPLLAQLAGKRGICSICKSEVIIAVGTLPQREPRLLADVQQWFCDLLALFADNIDPAVGDVILLETIIYCCIHTRCEAAKPAIVRIYSKYKMPNIFIPGGVNEVRKTIKKAEIGVLSEELDSAETIWKNADTSCDDDEDDEDDDDDDDWDDWDDWNDWDEDYYEDEEWAPRQEYCGHAYGGKARYLPVQKLKKYTLRIELEGSEPLVWRELEIPSSLSLASLAQAILLAMGWDEDHLHQFIGKNRDCYSTSSNDPGGSLFSNTKDGSRYSVVQLLTRKGSSIKFEYDYGDSWCHTVKLTEVAEYTEGEAKVIRLTGGANACPPDDCGGIYRYRHLVELMQDKPRSGELSEFYDWMGSKWDPAYFPMKEAAKAVNRMNK